MKKLLFIIYLLISFVYCYSQQYKVEWQPNRFEFSNATYTETTGSMPVVIEKFPLAHNRIDVSFLAGAVSPVNRDLIPDSIVDAITDEFTFIHRFSYTKKQPELCCITVPIRYNELTAGYEKLDSYYILIKESEDFGSYGKNVKSAKTSSVLASGNWYKFVLSEDGMYKISYQQLKDLGIEVDKIDPRTIKIYGNGCKMLPEKAGVARYDDLHELPITVSGENDGSFDSNDYIVFFGTGPDEWSFSSADNMFLFVRNLYTRQTAYFLTYGSGQGKRISFREPVTGTASATLTQFLDCQAHEKASTSPIASGKPWYGENFASTTTQSFSFNFPNIVTSKQGFMAYEFAARQNTASSQLSVTLGNFNKTHTLAVVAESTLGNLYARTVKDRVSFTPSSDNLSVQMTFYKPESTATAWLRYIYINAYRQLSFSSGQLLFRCHPDDTNGEIARFKISSSSNATVLDITNPVEPLKVETSVSSGVITFDFPTDTLRQFICYDATDYKAVSFEGKINNQNIHGMPIPDMVIVYYADFKEQAKLLYDYHNAQGLTTYMFDKETVFNEFSSGKQDICAIRDMMKMWYDRADEGEEPQYLLLFGDASYDPLDRLPSNTNFIPIYNSKDSTPLHNGISYATDDFFGFLDDGEGLMSEGDKLDIAIGRIPVNTVDYATSAVNKILHYATGGGSKTGNWKNMLTFIADDADNGEVYHLEHCEIYSSIIDNSHKEFNINKIYAGAYPQESSAGGQRYPEVTSVINARIEQGSLITCYAGHGSEKQLALEQLIAIADINSWRNYDRLTFFISATCEFARCDNPAVFSAGEQVFLNSKGGAVGMFTTNRVTSAPGNMVICSAFFNNAFNRKNNKQFLNIGDITTMAKNEGYSKYVFNTAAYTLFGDPAISLNYPHYNSVDIDEILVDGISNDTISAFSHVTINGHLCDFNGDILSDFNGTLFPEVHDKPALTYTLGNDNAPIQYFYIDNSLLYKGKVSISNGEFSFSFITPKDIAYTYAQAKMSFYYKNDETDGNGYFNEYIVGGSSSPETFDSEGPEITIYINDTTFTDGGATGENPIIYARLFDESGINTTGNGIGHDIVAFLDSNMDRTYTLNTYYEADLDTYKSGLVTYPMFNIDNGQHSILIRAWDTFNNPSTSEIDFIVVNSDEILISDLYNYPNPFSDKTNFVFAHNQAGYLMNLDLYIFSIGGNLVKTISTTLSSENITDNVLYWDGKSDNGSSVENGMYIYKLVITNENGTVSSSSGKMIKNR